MSVFFEILPRFPRAYFRAKPTCYQLLLPGRKFNFWRVTLLLVRFHLYAGICRVLCLDLHLLALFCTCQISFDVRCTFFSDLLWPCWWFDVFTSFIFCLTLPVRWRVTCIMVCWHVWVIILRSWSMPNRKLSTFLTQIPWTLSCKITCDDIDILYISFIERDLSPVNSVIICLTELTYSNTKNTWSLK